MHLFILLADPFMYRQRDRYVVVYGGFFFFLFYTNVMHTRMCFLIPLVLTSCSSIVNYFDSTWGKHPPASPWFRVS